jgi:hypothetical protein
MPLPCSKTPAEPARSRLGDLADAALGPPRPTASALVLISKVTFRSPFQEFSCRREGQTQTQAGYARTRRSQTANRAGRDRRCLSRRPTQRRQARTWAPGKTPFVAAVETTPEGKPVRLKLRRVASFCGHSIAGFAKTSLQPNCIVVSEDCGASAVSPMPFVLIRS